MMEGLLAWELGDLVLVPGLLLPALRMALGLSIHHLSNGYGNVFSLKVGKCTKVPGRGCGIGCTLPTLLGYSLQPHTFGVRGEWCRDPSRCPPQLFSCPRRKRTFRWRLPWEVRVRDSSLFLELSLQEVALGRLHPCTEQEAWNIQVSDLFLPTPFR